MLARDRRYDERVRHWSSAVAVSALLLATACKKDPPTLEHAVRAALADQALEAATVSCVKAGALGPGDHGQCSAMLVDGHELTIDVAYAWWGTLEIDTHVRIFDVGRQCDELASRREYVFDCVPRKVPLFAAQTFSFPFEGPRGHGVVTVDVALDGHVIATHWP